MTEQSTMRAVGEFLDERREVLAHAGDDNSGYHAICLALAAGNATAGQLYSYMVDCETQRRLDSSGVGVARWARLVLELRGFVDANPTQNADVELDSPTP
jgi:hypothetical protein